MISTEYDEELALSLARKHAIAEGRAEGLVKGRAEGKAEGRAEGKIEMIKEMLMEKFPIAMIARISKWSEEDILKIANQTFPVK